MTAKVQEIRHSEFLNSRVGAGWEWEIFLIAARYPRWSRLERRAGWRPS